MTPETLEWIEKAEEDWVCAQQDARRRKHPTNNAACFHAQQCAEKYLKARLQEANAAFQKTHNLLELLTPALLAEPGWNVLQSDLSVLNKYSIEYRYPGKSATKADAKAAVAHCRAVRKAARLSLGLPV